MLKWLFSRIWDLRYPEWMEGFVEWAAYQFPDHWFDQNDATLGDYLR